MPAPSGCAVCGNSSMNHGMIGGHDYVPPDPAHRPKRWNDDDDPEQWRQREAFIRKRALNHEPTVQDHPNGSGA